jgi:hypothetical protein
MAQHESSHGLALMVSSKSKICPKRSLPIQKPDAMSPACVASPFRTVMRKDTVQPEFATSVPWYAKINIAAAIVVASIRLFLRTFFFDSGAAAAAGAGICASFSVFQKTYGDEKLLNMDRLNNNQKNRLHGIPWVTMAVAIKGAQMPPIPYEPITIRWDNSNKDWRYTVEVTQQDRRIGKARTKHITLRQNLQS